jgi:phthalate 4,5-cis-dihydrodiol dehydrogenase
VQQVYHPRLSRTIRIRLQIFIRFTPDGVAIHGVAGRRDIKIPRGEGRPGHGDALDALWAAVRDNRRDIHDARWGKASVEVILAILRSARERREVVLEHQGGVER